jgi:hypothetical protein
MKSIDDIWEINNFQSNFYRGGVLKIEWDPVVALEF